jgi:hypothetical protein
MRKAEYLWPSAEQRLLLDAALLEDERALTAFREWQRTVDLDADFSYGSLRLLPLVYHNMHQRGVRDPLMGRLKGVYRRAWYESHQLFHRVQPVVSRLAASGIDVLLMKGAPLVLSYYRNHALRPMADVDLAVPRNRLDEALGILTRLGWRFAREPEPDMIRFHHALQCFGPEGGEIDLHWRLTYEISAEEAGDPFRTSAEPLDFMGTTVLQLDATHLLLQVVVHGVRWNLETPIRWIPDALAILRQRGSDIDWSTLHALADRLRVGFRLGLGLTWLAETFGAPVPPAALERFHASRVSVLERIENTVLLDDYRRFERSLLGNQWTFFVEYCRSADARRPLAFASGYSHYLRYRLQVDSRRQILPRIVNSVRRRLLADGDGTGRSPGEDA